MVVSKRVEWLIAGSALLLAAAARSAAGAMVLLDGASAPAAQGWAVTSLDAAAATVTNNGAYTEINTLPTTSTGARTSGVLLFRKDLSLSTLPAYQLDVVLQVLAGSSLHNTLDAGVSFGASDPASSFGTATTRAEMLYFEPNRIGWADDTGSFAMNTTDAFHTYSLTVNPATGSASVAVDGVQRLTRSGYVTTDQIAFGDQTNDPNVDGHYRVTSVTLVPEPAAASAVGFAGLALLKRRRRAAR